VDSTTRKRCFKGLEAGSAKESRGWKAGKGCLRTDRTGKKEGPAVYPGLAGGVEPVSSGSEARRGGKGAKN